MKRRTIAQQQSSRGAPLSPPRSSAIENRNITSQHSSTISNRRGQGSSTPTALGLLTKDGNLLIIPETTLTETTDTVTGEPIKVKLHTFISTFLNVNASNILTEDPTAPNNISNFIGIDLDSLSEINDFFHSSFEDICKVDNKNNKDMEAFIRKAATLNIDGKPLITTLTECENLKQLFFECSNNFISYEVIGKENTNLLKGTNILVNTNSTENNNTNADVVLDRFTIDKSKDHNIANILIDEFEKNHLVNLKELSPEQKQTILHNSLRKLPLHQIIHNYDKKTGEPKIRTNIVAPLIERLHNHGEYSFKNTINSYLDESYAQQASAILTKIPSEFKDTEEKPRLSLKLTVTDGELRVKESTLLASQQANNDSSKDLKLDMTKYFNNINPIIALNIATKTGFNIDTYIDIKGNDLLISRNGKPKDAYKLARTNLVNNNIHYQLPFTNEDTLPKASSHLRDEL